MDIEECIISIAKGNVEELEFLYNRMRVVVFGFVLSIVCDKKIAEDITQDTFIHIYNKASLYRSGMNPEGWIITIAKNLSLDALRKLKKFVYSEDIMESMNIEYNYVTEYNKLDLTNALMELSDIERQIVVLKVVAGFTHAEIALNLSMPEGTIKWKYRKALDKLRGLIGGDKYDT